MNLGMPKNVSNEVEFSQWLIGLDDVTIAKVGLCIVSGQNLFDTNNYFNQFVAMYNNNHNAMINVMDSSLVILSEMSRRWLESVVTIDDSGNAVPIKEYYGQS